MNESKNPQINVNKKGFIILPHVHLIIMNLSNNLLNT